MSGSVVPWTDGVALLPGAATQPPARAQNQTRSFSARPKYAGPGAAPLVLWTGAVRLIARPLARVALRVELPRLTRRVRATDAVRLTGHHQRQRRGHGGR